MTDPPNIYGALEGVASALTSTVKLLERVVNDWERREEELRDAHLDLANALNRRMDELHTRVDELEQTRQPLDLRGKDSVMPGMYTDSGVIEADDEQDAKVQAEEYVRQQFSDALGQAAWWFSQVDDDAKADNR